MSGMDLRDDRARGVLEAVEGGEVLGHVKYFVLDAPEPALVPVHTEVASAHEGKGVAGALAGELYAVAAREGLAVAPLCPYVVKWAERHPEQAPPASEEMLLAARDKARTDPSAW